MNKKKTRVFIIICSSIIIIGHLLFLNLERRTGYNYKTKMPDDFNFIAIISDNSYKINTYNNTLTKTIDWKKDTTIFFEMSKSQMQCFYDIVREIDIYKYPENYAPTSTVFVSPSPNFEFSFTIESNSRAINWKENTCSEVKDAKRLRNFFTVILEYIENDKRVKELPDSKRVFW